MMTLQSTAQLFLHHHRYYALQTLSLTTHRNADTAHHCQTDVQTIQNLHRILDRLMNALFAPIQFTPPPVSLAFVTSHLKRSSELYFKRMNTSNASFSSLILLLPLQYIARISIHITWKRLTHYFFISSFNSFLANLMHSDLSIYPQFTLFAHDDK